MLYVAILYAAGFAATWVFLWRVGGRSLRNRARQFLAALAWPAYWLIAQGPKATIANIKAALLRTKWTLHRAKWKVQKAYRRVARAMQPIIPAPLKVLEFIILSLALLLLLPFLWPDRERFIEDVIAD